MRVLLRNNLLVCVLHFGAALVGLRVVVLAAQVSPVWLPAGIALWGLLRFGNGVWPGIFAGALLGTLTTGAGIPVALGIALANTLEPLLGVWLLTRVFRFRPAMDRVDDVGALLLGGALTAPLLGASIGTAVMTLSGLAPPDKLAEVWWVWLLGDAMGVLGVAPLLLVFANGGHRRFRRERTTEALELALVTGVVSVLVFGGVIPAGKSLYMQAFLLFPPAMWAALRFGQRGAAVTVLAINVLAVWGTSHGLGPFAQEVVVDGVIVLQVFMGVLIATTQLLAAAFAERARAHSDVKMLAAAIQATQEGVVLTDAGDDARILYANAAFARISSTSPEALVGRSVWSFDGNGPESENRKRLDSALREDRPFVGEWLLIRAGGGTVTTELQVAPIRKEGEISQRVFTFRDVTERKRMKGQLVLAERMASVGLVAAGVGHEINNPLSFISTNLELLEASVERLDDPLARERMRGLVRDAAYGSKRIAEIVRSLRAVSRDAAHERSRVSLDELVERTLILAGPTLRHRAEVVKRLSPTRRVEANEARLGQVVLNLLVNAAQAIPADRPGRIEVITGSAEDDRAWFEVRDSGRGMPPTVRSRIFEPFFTTKPVGEGTGLGLFICQQIVHEHQGTIEVESAPEWGTRIRVVLPAVVGSAHDAAPPGGDRDRAPERARVLIVDDEVRLATSMRLLLAPHHDVELCHSGEEAVRRLGSTPYDVILCDLQMPVVDGMACYHRAVASNPDLAKRFIFVSGGAYSESAQAFLRDHADRVLEKPIPPELLLETIRRTLLQNA